MMRIKKVLVGVVIFIGLIVILAIAAPIIFKDEIKQAIDDQLEANINADVGYKIDNFGVSIFSNFPNLTASMEDLSVIGRGQFAGEVLFAVQSFEIEVSLWQLIAGSQLTIQGIYLDQPKIFIKVLADGTANYDITYPSDEAAAVETEESAFSMAIENWSIINGHIIYDDATLPTYVELTDVNHSGGGNFSLSVFDLDTRTTAYIKALNYDGDDFLTSRNVDIDMLLNMDLDNMKFSFKENSVAINNFVFGFTGWVAMPAEDIDMDISFSSQNNSFKSLISLIPVMYLSDFDDLETAGELKFDGTVAGTYNDSSMPAYNLNLEVTDGMFQYPDLPDAVSNVQVAMNIASQDGDIDKTSINVSRFHIDFGKEPVDGHIKIENLVTYPMDIEVNTSLNLANLTELFPVEGLTMEGEFKASLKVAGEYDSITSIIPRIDATINLDRGMVVYADLPAPLDEITIEATIVNSSGVLNDTRVAVPVMRMNLDGQPIEGDLLLENFDDINWRASLAGNFNFDKLFPVINKIYPMPGMTLSGDINTRFNTEGRLSDLEAEKYQALKTSGSAKFDKFSYIDSVYLPQGLVVNQGELSFTPKEIAISDVAMVVGASDFKFNGRITNYLNYLFQDEMIRGKMSLNSNKVDVNEFMTTAADEDVTTSEEEPYSVIEVPQNIDFIFSSSIKEISYDNITLKDAGGDILVRNGILSLDGLRTSTLGGIITFSGKYDTHDMAKPSFDLTLDVNNVAINQAFSAFNTIQAMAPIARNLDGKATTKFSLSGMLKEDMMPDLATINGAGLIKVLNAQLSNSKLVSGLTSNLKSGEKEALSLKDIAMNVRIEDGKLHVKPFDLKIENYTANISGNTALDGQLDYQLKLDVPAGNLVSQANDLLGSLTGTKSESDLIKLNFGVGGTYDDPKISLLGSDAKELITTSGMTKAKDLVKDKTGVELPTSKEEVNKEALEKAKKEAGDILAEAQKRADQVKAESAKAAEKVRAEAKVQSEKLLKEAGANPFKKKAAEIAGKKLIDEANKKAITIESEGIKQADAIMAKAQEQADTIIQAVEKK